LLCSLFKRFDVVVDDVVLCFHFVDDSKGLKRTRQRFSYFDEQTREQTREQNSSKTPTRRPTSHRELPRQLLECRSP
jgi:acetyl-CoA carboxylase carboxyltransferase component